MHLAVSGGTGLVGAFVVEAALARGWRVTVLGRRAPVEGVFSRPVGFLPLDLGGAAPPDLAEIDALVHCALSHVPQRYRGGEGDDPDGFRQRNETGSLRLFDRARSDGVGRVVFLSSRAVFDGHPAGTVLTESLPPKPASLYGAVKLAVERGLSERRGDGFAGSSLRATGVYGAAPGGQGHKWAGLFRDWAAGRPIAPRAGTELHGADLADAVLRLLLAGSPPAVAHASDLLLDRHDLLAEVAALTGLRAPLPPRDDRAVSVLSCDALRGLGWRPGGRARLAAALPDLVTQAGLTLRAAPQR